MNIYKVVLLLLMGSCSFSSQVDFDPFADNVYISNGVEQYYLSDIPMWANFSTDGKCFLKNQVRYLDYEKINKSYDLSYQKSTFLQHMINRRILSYRSSMGTAKLSPKDEAFIFQNSYQKIAGGSSEFIVPKYKKISVIWLDSLENEARLKSVLNRSDVGLGHPVILSLCKTSFELEELVINLGLENRGIRFISSEMVSVFNKNMQKTPKFSLNVKEILKGKEIKIFRTKNAPNSLFGDLSTTYIK